MIKIAHIAINGSNIVESVKTNYISFTELYQSGTGGGGTDSEGNPKPTYPIYSTATHHTDAKIIGVVVANQTLKVGGTSIACVGDITEEQWVADPSPSPQNGGSITSISPGTSGIGQGSITGGNSKNAKLNGKLVAVVGSQVITCLGNTTTIENGNEKLNM